MHSNRVLGDPVSATGCEILDAFDLKKESLKEGRLEKAKKHARARAKRIQSLGICIEL